MNEILFEPELEKEYGDYFDEWGLPPYMREGVVRWIVYGKAPGDFLCAVMKDSLSDAAGYADACSYAFSAYRTCYCEQYRFA